MPSSKPRKAVLYLRVSDQRQVENYSLETQEKACREYCQRNGWKVAAVFREEGESAKTTDRPQLREMLQWCRPGRADVVLVFRFSRAARNAADYHTIKGMLAGRGMELVSVTETRGDSPAEHLLENVIAAINQFDNEVRAEQSRSGLIQAAREGRWVWHTPLGYKKDEKRRIVLDPVVAPILRQAFERAASGAAYRHLVDFLASRGVVTKKGNPLAVSHMQKILASPFYRGRLVNRKWKLDVPGQWEPLISEELWNRVQRDRTERARPEMSKKRPRLRPDFPLKRFVHCPNCHEPSTGSWSRGRSRRYAYYHCIHCHGFRVRKEELETHFVDLLRNLKPQPPMVKLWAEVVSDTWRHRHTEHESRIDQAGREAKRLESRRGRLLDLALDGAVGDEVFRTKMDDLDRQLAAARLAASQERQALPNLEVTVDHARRFLSQPDRIWIRADLAAKVRFQNLVFPEGIEYSSGSGFGTASTACIFNELGLPRFQNEQVVRLGGLEPPTLSLGNSCSIHLSYSRTELGLYAETRGGQV